MSNLEEIHEIAIKNLKIGLPKIITIIFILFILYFFTILTESLIKNIYFEYKDIKIEASKVLTIISLVFILLLIVIFYSELEILSFSLASLIAYYSSNPNEKEETIKAKILKLRNSFRMILFSISALILFFIFKDFLVTLSPNISFFIFVFLTIWFLFSLLLFSMSISSEIEIFRKRKNA